jgi:iron complex outermembrane recepter protein
MNHKLFIFSSCLFFVLDSTAFADDLTSSPSARIEVTGSSIRRIDAETSSPIQIVTAEEIKQSGYTSLQEILHNLTANGQGTLSQGFAPAFASGAAGAALRGLTVGSTLVLIDGHRMAPFPMGDDGQRSFVDIANIPFDAVERVEILKDGASAIYGSDAMAGVVNVILKKSFTGRTVTVDVGRPSYKAGQTTHVSGMVGFGDLNEDGHNFYLSGEVRTQKQITFADRGGLFTQTDFTSTGGLNLTPGVSNALNGGYPGSTTGYLTNYAGTVAPLRGGCNQTNSYVNIFSPSANTQSGPNCPYSNSQFQIQPPTENYYFIANYVQKLPEAWTLKMQASYFESLSQQVGSPSSTSTYSGGSPNGYLGLAYQPGSQPVVLNPLGFTTLPANSPLIPNGWSGPAYLVYNFQSLGPQTTNTDSKSVRLIADLNGHWQDWDIQSSMGYTEVALGLRYSNFVNLSSLQTALNNGTYVIDGNNSAASNNYIAPELSSTSKSQLAFVHLDGNRELMQLEGGPLLWAMGTDWMYKSIDTVAPSAFAQGLVGSNTNFKDNFTIGSQDVFSAYTEMVAPWTQSLESDAALRYDHYNLSGGHVSPKFGVKFHPLPEWAFRGTVSGGFRAPSPSENGKAGNEFVYSLFNDTALCNAGYGSQCLILPPFAIKTNPVLKPEVSKSVTLGMIYQPVSSFSATLDFYAIEIDHQIVPNTSMSSIDNAVRLPVSDLPPCSGTCSAVPYGPIAYIPATYINANSTRTNGFELGFDYRHLIDEVGMWRSKFMVTYVNSYDMTINGVTYHMAGTHGPSEVSGDTGNPRTRAQWTNTLLSGAWTLSGTLNYISSFSDVDPSVLPNGMSTNSTAACVYAISNNGGAGAFAYANQLNNGSLGRMSCKTASFTTLDVYSRYQWDKSLSLHGAVTNLFNRWPPFDWATYAGMGMPYNPSLHSSGGVGRYFSIGATYTFE